MKKIISLLFFLQLMASVSLAGIDNLHLAKGPAIAKDARMRSFGIAGYNDQHIFVLWNNTEGYKKGRYVEAFDRGTLKSVYSSKLDFANEKSIIYCVMNGQKLILVYGLDDPKDNKKKLCAVEVDDKGLLGPQKVLMTEGADENDLLRYTLHTDYLSNRILIVANQAQNNNITKHKTPRIEIYDLTLTLLTKAETDKTEKPLDEFRRAMLDGYGNAYFSVSHANGTTSVYVLKAGTTALKVVDYPGYFYFLKDKNGVAYFVSKSKDLEKFRVIRFNKSGDAEVDQESSFPINSDGTKPKSGKVAKAHLMFHCYEVLLNTDGTTALVWKFEAAGSNYFLFTDIQVITLDNNLTSVGSNAGWFNMHQAFAYAYDQNAGAISLTDGKHVYMVYNTNEENLSKTEKFKIISSNDIYKVDAVTCIAKMNGEKVYEQKVFVDKGANKYSLIQPGYTPKWISDGLWPNNPFYYYNPVENTLKVSDKEVYTVLNTNGELSLVKITLD